MRIFVFLLVLFSLISCKSNDSDVAKRPDHLIKKDKMVEILCDFRLVEATIRQKAGGGEDTKAWADYYYSKIFKKYGITKETFDENMRYLSTQPDELHEIFAEVVNRLTEIHAEVSTPE